MKCLITFYIPAILPDCHKYKVKKLRKFLNYVAVLGEQLDIVPNIFENLMYTVTIEQMHIVKLFCDQEYEKTAIEFMTLAVADKLMNTRVEYF